MNRVSELVQAARVGHDSEHLRLWSVSERRE
jgi:hypothetical protein